MALGECWMVREQMSILGGYAPYRSARRASLLRQSRLSEAVRFLCSSLNPWEATKLLLHCADYLWPFPLRQVLRKVAGRDPMPPRLNRKCFGSGPVLPLLRLRTECAV